MSPHAPLRCGGRRKSAPLSPPSFCLAKHITHFGAKKTSAPAPPCRSDMSEGPISGGRAAFLGVKEDHDVLGVGHVQGLARPLVDHVRIEALRPDKGDLPLHAGPLGPRGVKLLAQRSDPSLQLSKCKQAVVALYCVVGE